MGYVETMGYVVFVRIRISIYDRKFYISLKCFMEAIFVMCSERNITCMAYAHRGGSYNQNEAKLTCQAP